MTASAQEGGRAAQRAWTSGRIVDAANAMMAAGATPTVSEAAIAAGVSRATAYRYFPTQGDLLIAAVRRAMGDADVSEAAVDGTDATSGLATTAQWLIRSTIRNEHQLRALYAHLLDAWLRERRGEPMTPLPRGARIAPLQKALEPLGSDVTQADRRRLLAALSVLIGIEGWMVLHDMWGMEPDEAEQTLMWAAQTLLSAVVSAPTAPPATAH